MYTRVAWTVKGCQGSASRKLSWYNFLMKISHGTRIKNIEQSNGYGYATANMLASLARLDYEVNQNDPSADVEIWFDQPHYWKFSKGPYRIGYHPWESTKLLPPDPKAKRGDWKEAMDQCDEIWTPSPLIAKWYKDFMDIRPPVYVYEHGVDPVWAPKKRAVEDKFNFLHIGGEACRKGVSDTMKAFNLAFGKRPDVELNLKMICDGWNIGAMRQINILNGRMSFEDLLQLYYDNHVFVYPSYGEGFGLTPLQAMATGMPTIVPGAWAPYAEYLDPHLNISSTLGKTPWPKVHPGHMFHPDMDELIEAMRYTYYNFEVAEKWAHEKVDELTAYYDWDRLTENMFKNLEKRLENSTKIIAPRTPA